MENNSMVIRGSFRGILGDLLKKIIILICTTLVYFISNNVENQYYKEYNIDSFISFVIELQHPYIMAILSFIFILYIILLLIFLSTLYKTIILLYETLKTTVIDFQSGKITVSYYTFPFNKEVQEHKFNEIININISQNLFQRLFQTGNLYIEYLTYSKLDSQLRTINITYVVQPFTIKPELI